MSYLLLAVNAISTLVICGGCFAAFLLAIVKGPDPARLLLANVILWALGFLLAATLIRMLGLRSWLDVGSFAIVFLVRLLVKGTLREELAIAAPTVNFRA